MIEIPEKHQLYMEFTDGVLQDILFRAGVNPKSKLKVLEDKRKAVFESVRETLAEMTEKGVSGWKRILLPQLSAVKMKGQN